MVEVRQTPEFETWLDGLAGDRAQTKVLSRISKMAEGSSGDWKSVGKGVFESRINHGPGYRIYFTRRGNELIMLLAGGDKSTQRGDIRLAQKLAAGL